MIDKIDRKFINPLQLASTVVCALAGYFLSGAHAAIFGATLGMTAGALISKLDAMYVGESAGALIGASAGYLVAVNYAECSYEKTTFVMCVGACAFMAAGELAAGILGGADGRELRQDLYRTSFGLAGGSLGLLAGVMFNIHYAGMWYDYPLALVAGSETGMLTGWLAGCAAGRTSRESMTVQYYFVSFTAIGLVVALVAGYYLLDELYSIWLTLVLSTAMGAVGWKIGRNKAARSELAAPGSSPGGDGAVSADGAPGANETRRPGSAPE